MIGAEGEPYTGNNGGLNNSHTRRVKCIIFHLPPSPISVLDGIKTLKEKCFNSKIFRRVHDQMVEIAIMFLLKVKPRTLTDWEESCDLINYHCMAIDGLGFEWSNSSEARPFNSLSIGPDNYYITSNKKSP